MNVCLVYISLNSCIRCSIVAVFIAVEIQVAFADRAFGMCSMRCLGLGSSLRVLGAAAGTTLCL